MSAGQTLDGRWTVKNPEDFSAFRVFNTKEELESFISSVAHKKGIDLDAGHSWPWMGETSSPIHPNFGEPLEVSGVGRMAAAFQTSVGRFFTPMEAYAQAVEKSGLGRAFSLVYEPTQKAMNKVHQMLRFDKHMVFADAKNPKGKTFDEALSALRGKVAGLTKDEQELSMYYSEALSRQELERPGGMFKNGLSADEVRWSRDITKQGLSEEVPRLIALAQSLNSFATRRVDFMSKDFPALMLRVQEKELPEEFGAHLMKLRALAGEEKNLDEIIKGLKLNEAEQNFIQSYLDPANKGIRWAGVYRHAASFDLEKGFANGKAQFAAQRGVRQEVIDVANDRDAILKLAFGSRGMNHEQLVYAQMPTFRKFIEVGLPPSKKNINPLSVFEEGTDVFSKRILGGSLSPYNLDPLTSTYKQVRNLVMKEQYDPVAREAADAIRNTTDLRTQVTLARYMLELEGFPNEGFEQLNAAFKTMGRALGVGIDDNLAQRVVTLLTNLSYKASIPFRAALVVRNYTQTAFFTAPVVGPKHWIRGMKVASGMADGVFNREAYERAFEEAVRAGAVDPGTLPLHGASEIFGQFERTLPQAANKTLREAEEGLEKAFDWAFEKYRGADDWGRAVAYHAGKGRVNEYVGAFKRGELSLERFKELAKVKTFDATIEAEFTRLLATDTDAAASYIGKNLADRTHLLYGNANHPVGWGGPFGRLFGQFGTFPVQYLNYLTRGMTRGTKADIAQFAAIHGGLNIGVGLAGANVAGGIDLWNWSTFPSLSYSGGPYLDMATNLYQMTTGSEAERSIARRNLALMVPTLEHPASIVLPGSYFVNDLAEAGGSFMDQEYLDAFINVSGFRKLRPKETNPIEQMFGFIMDGKP